MTNEPIGADGLADPNIALHHEAERIADRLPNVDVEQVEDRLHQAYEALDEQATVKSHLITIAGSQVADDLRAEAALDDARREDAAP